MINDLDIAQWGYLLSPEFELINSAGKPLTGGYIEVYIHGTRNKYYCASDFNGTLHPFQIPLDSLGSNIVLASPAHAYDVYVYNKYGSLIMSRYNVLPQVQGTAVVSGEINITSNDNTVTVTQVGDNNFDLSVAETVSSITDMVTDVVSAVSSNLMNEIIETAQDVSGLIPDVSNFATHTDVNEAIVTAIDLVTSIIPVEQVQSDWEQDNPAEPDYIKNKPDMSNLVTENELVTAITAVTGMIPSTDEFATHTEVYNSTVTAINLVTSIIPEAQVQSNWTETDTSDPSYIQNKPEEYTVIAGQNIGIFVDGDYFTIAASGTDLTNYATHSEVNNVSGQIISTMNDVSGTIVEMIPSAQVQSDWEQSDSTQPDYIKNKPNLNDYVTDQEFIEVVSAVTGIGDYGQFYSTAVSGGAIMSRTKGTIDVTNDGKIKLKKGNSYHVTVRGRYNASTLTNVYGDISYIEYITFNPIHINVDKTIPESQYFELSYDLYQLNSDSDYYVFFSGLDGTINDLYIEIHNIGHVGAGGTVTGSPEYDAGWGIQILNNVISVNPSIIPDDINLVAGNNIGIIVSGSNLVIAASGSDLSDYATLEQLQDSVELVTGLIPTVQLNDSDQVTAINNYPIYSEGGGTQYSAGDGIDITNNVISVDNNVALKSDIPDVSNLVTEEELVTAVTAVSARIPPAQVQSNWIETNTSSKAYIQNKPLEYSVVAGQNIGIAVNGTNLVISAANPDLTSYATHSEVNNVSGAIVNLIPAAQVQSNWTETNTSSKAYIKNKPDLTVYATHSEVNNVSGAIVNLIPDVSSYTTRSEVNNVSGAIISDVNDVSGAIVNLIPDVTDYATHSEVNNVSGAIVNLIPDVSDFATVDQVTAVSGYLQNEIDNIPAQEQANWSQTDDTQVDYIKNKPDLNVYTTHSEVNNVSAAIMDEIPDVSEFATESEVNNVSGILEGHIQTVSAAIPDISNLATKTEVITQVQAATAMIPDVSDFATESEVNEATASAIEYVTELIPDISPLATKVELQDDIELVTAMIPPAQIQSDWSQSDNTQVDYIKNKPDLNVYATHAEVNNVSGAVVNLIPDVSDFATESEVIAQVQAATAMIPDISDLATKDELQDGLELVTGMIPDISDLATKDELQDGLELVTGMIPDAQVQSDWTQSDNTQVDYIKNKPTETTLYAGDNINITVSGVSAVISSTGGGGGATYTAGDHIGIENNEISVTGITELVAGNAITITTSGASAIISSTGEAQVQSNWNETNQSSKAYIQNKPTIPAAQVQSNWNETNTSSKAYIQNKPTIHNYSGASGINITNDTITLDNPIGLVAGDNITIEVSGVSAIISATGGGGGTQVQSDWTQTDNTQVDYIKNKPIETTLIAVSGIELTVSGDSAIISASGIMNILGDVETALSNL